MQKVTPCVLRNRAVLMSVMAGVSGIQAVLCISANSQQKTNLADQETSSSAKQRLLLLWLTTLSSSSFRLLFIPHP